MLNKDKSIFAAFAVQFVLIGVLIFLALNSSFRTPSSGSSIDYSPMDMSAPQPSAPRAKYSRSMSAPEAVGSMAGGAASLLMEVAEANETSSQYLVKTGRLRGRVDSLNTSREGLLKILKKSSATIVSENQSRYNQSINLDLTIKVPAKNFETLMNDLTTLTNFLDSKSSQVLDKFKEFTDIEENIKNQSLLREKYRIILKNAKKVKDLLEIERELANVQRRIDGYKKQLSSLKDLIARSTINASLYEQLPLSKQKNSLSFLRQFSNSFVKGLTRTKSFFLWLISIWPFVLIIGVFIFWFLRKKLK